jgi:diadenylate cyclase
MQTISDFFQKIFQMTIPYIRIIDIIQILIITILIYNIIVWLRNTKAWSLLKGLLVLLVFYIVAGILNMTVIIWIVNNCLSVAIMAVVIIFQPELRQALDRIGNLSRKGILQNVLPFDFTKAEENVFTKETAEELLNASCQMAAVKTGALIVIQQKIGLKNYVQRWGTDIDAVVGSEILINIFEKNTPLHDGAVIIIGNRIAAAKCFLPLNENEKISAKLGTRHHAAAGISEITDSVTVIVSEETGSISIARNGTIKTGLDRQELEEELLRLCPVEDTKERKNRKISTNRKGSGL